VDYERRWKPIQFLRWFDKDLPDISFLPGRQRYGAVTFTQSLRIKAIKEISFLDGRVLRQRGNPSTD
jgi:hypothetical protein